MLEKLKEIVKANLEKEIYSYSILSTADKDYKISEEGIRHLKDINYMLNAFSLKEQKRIWSIMEEKDNE